VSPMGTSPSNTLLVAHPHKSKFNSSCAQCPNCPISVAPESSMSALTVSTPRVKRRLRRNSTTPERLVNWGSMDAM